MSNKIIKQNNNKNIKKNNNTNKNNNKKNKVKQNGGNVIQASIDLVDSMKSLGKSIFDEIKSITHIKNDMNSAATSTQSTPNVINGPPKFNAPKL